MEMIITVNHREACPYKECVDNGIELCLSETCSAIYVYSRESVRFPNGTAAFLFC